MQAMRMAVCIVMAVSWTAAFAAGSDAAATASDEQTKSDSNQLTEAKASGSEELGATSGEPVRMDARADDARASQDGAIREYNEQRFVTDVWAQP